MKTRLLSIALLLCCLLSVRGDHAYSGISYLQSAGGTVRGIVSAELYQSSTGGIVTITSNNQMNAYLSDGSRSYERRSFPTGPNPVGLASGAFDGQGQDIVVAQAGNDTMRLFLGDYDGNFYQFHDYPTGGTPKEVLRTGVFYSSWNNVYVVNTTGIVYFENTRQSGVPVSSVFRPQRLIKAESNPRSLIEARFGGVYSLVYISAANEIVILLDVFGQNPLAGRFAMNEPVGSLAFVGNALCVSLPNSNRVMRMHPGQQPDMDVPPGSAETKTAPIDGHPNEFMLATVNYMSVPGGPTAMAKVFIDVNIDEDLAVSTPGTNSISYFVNVGRATVRERQNIPIGVKVTGLDTGWMERLDLYYDFAVMTDDGQAGVSFSGNTPILVTTHVDEDDGTVDQRVGAGTSIREALNEAARIPGPNKVSIGFDLPHLLVTQAAENDPTYGKSAFVITDDVTIEMYQAIYPPYESKLGPITFARPNGPLMRLFRIAPGGKLTIQDAEIRYWETFEANAAGGAVLVQGSFAPIRSEFDHNFSNSVGGAIAVLGGELNATNCTFATNGCHFSSAGGSAIAVTDGTANLTYLSIADNSGGNSVLSISNSDVTMVNSFITRYSGVGIQGALNPASHHNIDNPTLGGIGTLVEEGFQHVLPLLPNCTAIDAAATISGITTDGRQNPRPQGSAPDIGAYELNHISAPIVTNPFFDNVTNSSARMYGSVTSDNGYLMTGRGIVYSRTALNSNPTLGGTGVTVLDDPQVQLGTFNRTATGLNPSTSYSFAAYAYNSQGAGYSPVVTFQTNPAPGAGSLVVTTIADEDNGNSDPANGAGTSLREAVAYANALGGDQTITFSPNLFANGPVTITISGALNSILLSNLSGTTTIDGPGATLLTISGNNSVRMFRKEGGAARFNGMTLANGHGGDGSAIYSQGSTLYVNDCIFTNNVTNGSGGAIYNGPLAYISRCTFVNNSAPGFSGGAIANEGTAWVMNSTFSGNSADQGGAIANAYGASILRVICSTLTNNSASSTGGGILVINDQRTFLHNTIVSGNSAPNGANLEATLSSFALTGSLIDADPTAIFATGQLANNGGSTPTIALKSGGLAINAGTNSVAVDNNATALTTDQRGKSRVISTTVDIGAYEATESLVVSTSADENNGTSDPDVGVGTSLREALISAQVSGGAQTITFAPALAGQTIILNTAAGGADGWDTSSALSVTGNITIEGLTTGSGLTLSVGTGATLRHFVVRSGASLTLSNLTLTGGKPDLASFDRGGAISAFGDLTARNCTFTGNTSPGEGGAVQNWPGAANLVLENCTFSGNSSGSHGSAISANGPQATFRHLTITNNTAANSALVFWGTAGTMVDTILAGNSNDSVLTGSGGTFTDQSTNNLLGASAATGLTHGSNGNQLGVPIASLMLGSLGNNGGATQTIKLQSGSVALNAGVAIPGLLTDQRGITRPQGNAVDIGAFEARLAAAPTFSVSNLNRLLSDSAFNLATASGASPAGGTFSGPGVSGGNFNPAAAGTGVHTIGYGVASADGVVASATFTVTINQPATITSGDGTTFTVGTNGSLQLSASGFPATYTFTNTGVALPSGVTLSSSGLLSGTPADGTGGVYNLTFKVSNGVAPDGTQSFTLAVNEAPEFTSASNKTFTVGVAGTTHQLTASGFPSTFAFINTGSALPSGLSLSSAGLLSGTPDAGTGGVYHLTFQASNGVDPVSSQSFTLTVNQPLAFTSADATTFTVGTAGSFNVTASGFPAPTFSTNSALPNGVSLSATGVLSGTPMPGTGGTYSLTITASNGGTDTTQSFTLTVNQAPAVTSASNATFTVGNTGSFKVEAAGFPAPSLSESGTLPSGVTFTPETGILSGTPASGTAGSYPLTFTATNGVGNDATQTFTLTINDAVCVEPPADLVAWYPGEGDATDVKGGLHGTPLNGAAFVAGKAGQGFAFNDITAVVQVPDNDAWDLGANAFTIETWVKFNAVSGSDVLAAHSEGTGNVNKWIFWLHNGALEFHLNGSAVANITSDAAFAPVIGQWHHVAITRSGNTYRFYVDGVQNGGERFDSNSVPNATAPLTFGKAEVIPALNGMLDEVKIFSRALNTTQIQSIYNASTEGFCADALETLSAVSRKTHGSAGDFEVPLPLTGEPGVECRTGGANGEHTIVVTFNNVVTGGTAAVSGGSVSGIPSFTLNTMKVNLTGVANAQSITITLNDVTDGFGQTLPSVVMPMNVLLGDTNASRSVTASDVSQVKALSGDPTDAMKFRCDFNTDGTVNASDISQVKAVSGTVIP